VNKVIEATQKDLVPIPGFAPERFACILIVADFVTLDLQGYTIIGPGGTPGGVGRIVGIATDLNFTRQAVRVHSGAVTGFNYGVYLTGMAHAVEKIRSTFETQYGVVMFGLPLATGHRLTDSTAIGNGTAGFLMLCPGVVLKNVASGNGNPALEADEFEIVGTCTYLDNYPLIP
jgi:hypothetical protein